MSGNDSKRFIADVMVGKLARYLRMAGHDVVYMNDADDYLIMDIARSQNRIVLTRDTMMLKRKEFSRGAIRSVFIEDDSLAAQLLQVEDAVELELRPELCVCLVCNSRLREVHKEDVRGKVPEYVYDTQDGFKYCSSCQKYYWRGTHYEYIKAYFNRLRSGRHRSC